MRKRPLIRYHGSKFRIAPHIISEMPAHKVYCEPFGGGAGVLLKKERSYCEVYNDLDAEIVNLFLVARDRGQQLAKHLELTPFSREVYFKAYEPENDSLKRAANTVIKSLMGFGSDAIRQKSGFRNNSNRSYTTPALDWKNYPQALQVITDRLQGVIIENMPALKLIKKFDGPDTVFYVDPPYLHSTRQSAKRYNCEMSDMEHLQLATALQDVKGKVIVSGYDSELYNKLYAGWRKKEFYALADGARKRTEVLWFNF